MTNNNKKKIVLTGGGTAGHVTPNIALLPYLKNAGYEIVYIGSVNGIERDLIQDCGIRYVGVPTGKLRRYFDLKNFTDPFRVTGGFLKARSFLKKYRPDVVFSKGGFVSVPVVRAAAALKIPCVIHESDMTPGLANKLCFKAASKVCCNFPETMENLPKDKAVLTGTPIRDELFSGSREEGLRLCGFINPEAPAAGSGSEENAASEAGNPATGSAAAAKSAGIQAKPVLLVMGGSQGARSVNEAIRRHLDELLPDFNIIHLCGAGKYDASKEGLAGYKQFEYVKEDLKHIFAAADIIVSRAGANAIFEILALQKPSLLIPLSAGTRGDQILNARSFEAQGFSEVLVESEEEGVLDKKLVSTIHLLYQHRGKYLEAMASADQQDSIPMIMDLLNDLSGINSK